MNNIKFIYFDIGDTLVAEANSKLVMNVLNIPEEIFKKTFNAAKPDMYKGILTPLDFLNSIKQNLNMPVGEAFDNWNRALSNLSIIEPMQKLVKDLKAKYKVGLLTNILVGHFELLNSAGKIPNISYDAIVKSCDEGVAKPQKEIFEIAVGKAQVQPSEILFVDNKKEYIDAAISYGWNGFIFDPKNPLKSVGELRNILL